MTTHKNDPSQNENLRRKVEKLLASGGEQAVIDSLTGKQRSFVEHYVRDYQLIEAVYSGGFSPASRENARKMGEALLGHPAVVIALRHYSRRRTEKATADTAYVIQKWLRLIEAMDENAIEKKDPKAAATLLRASELLARHLSMFTDKVELTGKDGGPIQTEEIKHEADAFASAIAGLASRNGEAERTLETRH
jgi:phage terminase small subunit